MRSDRDYSNVKADGRTGKSLKFALGEAIKRERSSLGMSQGELALRAGLHRTYVSGLERGQRNPSIESIEKLARALHVSVARLFDLATNGDRSTK
jgi:transcriptional regulator with XRE-family HTH domain